MSFVGIALLAALFAWLFGGVLLRLGGLILVLEGMLGLVLSGDAHNLLIAAEGVVLWLAGQWHFALRHREFKSPLADRVFLLAPAWLDPCHDRAGQSSWSRGGG